MNKILIYLVPIATLITITVNFLSGTGRINDITPQILSDSYPIYFVPAGYVFSIWSLIYIGIIGYSIFQFLTKYREDKSIEKTRVPFIISCLANISWIFLWHYELPILSVLAMLVLLASLINIYLSIDRSGTDTKTLLFQKAPFSLYLGWISVATISNISVALYVLQWNGFGISGEIWAAILILAATMLGVVMILNRKDIIYSLVIIWGIYGIYSKFFDREIIKNITFFGVIVLTALIVYLLLSKKELIKKYARINKKGV